MPAHPIPPKLRFWRRVQKTATCWLWTGKVNNAGYGRFAYFVPRRHVLAHRQAWTWAFGPIAAGVNILHRCDTPRCVRPTHLFAGTHQVNMADMVAKARNPRGERNGRCTRLNDQAVRVIRFLAPRVSSRKLADTFGVSDSYIRRIVAGTIWQGVTS